MKIKIYLLINIFYSIFNEIEFFNFENNFKNNIKIMKHKILDKMIIEEILKKEKCVFNINNIYHNTIDFLCFLF